MLVHREAAPTDGDPKGTLLCVHGYPESSYMWTHVLEAAAAAGWRAVAPDLPGFGDSPKQGPSTWDRFRDALAGFHEDTLDGEPVVLCAHDWGGHVGLSFACEHPEAVRGLVISDTGFFADGKWHGLADVMRTPGEGEQLVEGFTKESFDGMLRGVAPGITDKALAEYWKGFDGTERRHGHLEYYRGLDFAPAFAPYDGQLATLDVPTLVLWGENDPFAPISGAHRFAKLPQAELKVLDGAGHFIFDERADEAAAAVTALLERVA